MPRRLIVGILAMTTLTAGCGTDQNPGPAAKPTTSTPTIAPAPSPAASPSQTGSSPTPSPVGSSWTACATIWAAGKRLPLRYPGCLQGGTPVPAEGRPCLVGHDLVVFEHRFYAMSTGRIFESDHLASDPGYAQTKYLCKHGTPRN